MKKDFIRVMAAIACSFLGVTFLILINCGGGGDNSSTPPPPPDNFGSIMSVQPIEADSLATKEKISTEEFWTKEKIFEAVKNPIKMKDQNDMKFDVSPLDKATPKIPEGVQITIPPYNPDADKESKLINKMIFSKDAQSWVSGASYSCPSSSYKIYSSNGYQHYPERTMGVVVFKIKTDVYSCTASLINKRMILTAAHCVSSDATWHTNFRFIPGFNNGDNWEPYGHFSASQVLIYSGWFNNTFYPADYAIIVLKDAIGDQLGWIGSVYNLSPVGKTWDQCGYPAEPVSDGKTLLINRSAYDGDDCSKGTPCRTVVGSPFVEGASGGPWILWQDSVPYINGNNSQYNSKCTAIASPYFDDKTHSLYKAAQSLQ